MRRQKKYGARRDKSPISLLLFAAIVGLVSYDRFMVIKKKESPIKQMIGFLRHGSSQIGTGVINEKKPFEYNARQLLVMLKDQQQHIKVQREKFLHDKTDLLNQMIEKGKSDATKYKRFRQGCQNILDEAEGNENRLQQNMDQVYLKFEDFIEQLITVTRNDMRDLIYLYQELESQYIDWLAQAQTRQAYWYQLTMSSDDSDFFQDLIEKYDINAFNLSQTLHHCIFENQKFLVELTKFMDVDIQKLVEDQDYASQKNNEYIVNHVALRAKRAQREIKENNANIGE